jgi:hypothetical protein
VVTALIPAVLGLAQLDPKAGDLVGEKIGEQGGLRAVARPHHRAAEFVSGPHLPINSRRLAA